MARLIQEKIDSLSLYELDGKTIDDAIEYLEELKKRHRRHEKITFDLRSQEYSDDKEYALIVERPENEKELKARLDCESRSREYRLAQYKQLQKEFGPSAQEK